MEVIVCGVVGGLTALCAHGLLDMGAKEELERMASGVHRLVRELRGRAGRLELALAERGVVSPRLRARRAKIEAAMPGAFGALAISLGSGLSLSQALRYVGSHSQEPVRGEFLRASASMTCGESPVFVLDELVGRLRAPGLELVGLALKVSRLTGAPMGGLLSQAARVAEERMELMRQLDVKTSQARMSARMVSLMPVAMSVLLSAVSADYREGLGTVPGMTALAVALVLNVVAAIVVRKIMRIEM